MRFVKWDDDGRERTATGRDEENRLLKIAGSEFDPDDALFKILSRLGADDFEFRRGQEFRPRAEEGEPAGADRGAFEGPVGGGRDPLAVGADERRAARVGFFESGRGRLKIRREVGGECERGAVGHESESGTDRDEQRGVEWQGGRIHRGTPIIRGRQARGDSDLQRNAGGDGSAGRRFTGWGCCPAAQARRQEYRRSVGRVTLAEMHIPGAAPMTHATAETACAGSAIARIFPSRFSPAGFYP